MIVRKKTKRITVGGVALGGGADIAIQSMTSTKTSDIESTVSQIAALAHAGCDIVRVAVPDIESARAIEQIKARIPIPLVADIHFDYRLALEAAAHGADKIRINPGNIGEQSRVREVCEACGKRGIPIRIGINAGSLERHLLEKHGAPTHEALIESARYNIALLERFSFHDICLSIKSSDVAECIRAYRALSEMCDYPLHLGVTEAGTMRMGTLKSAIGIGSLLAMGIGDTIRVSLTEDPVLEIAAAKDILKAVGLNKTGVTIVSCPTCARCKAELIDMAKRIEAETADYNGRKITVAVMGCAVNGPGEAREADLGVACGDGEGLLFKKGQIHKKVPDGEIVRALLQEIKDFAG